MRKLKSCFLTVCSLMMAVVFVLVSCFAAAGETAVWVAWDCPNCGRAGNTGNFCGGCGSPAPSREEASGIPEGAEKYAQFRTAGNIVTFGRYEQDNDPGNGAEEIEWIVLEYDEKENKALLVSKYGLDMKPYHADYADTTWENCTLREWLNGEFLKDAFTPEEQSAIVLSNVDNSRSQGYWSGDGGNNTQDRIFLLSYAEANRYFGVTYQNNNVEARVAPTAYAISRGAWTGSYMTSDNKPSGWWWLRSPGSDQSAAAGVLAGGSLNFTDISVNSGSGIVRPAFRLDLESDGGKAGMISAAATGSGNGSDESPVSIRYLTDPRMFRTAGNIVTFGRYEQDNDPGNGAEEIEWIVLEYDEKENKALLISKYGLDMKPYHADYTDTTWENCTLREWLNGEFLKDAFTPEEQSAIMLSDVDNSRSQGYWSGDGGNNTQDRIFLLSYAEANRYFGVTYQNNNVEARVAPTAYAISRGAWTGSYMTSDNEPSGWWWLRSPGSDQSAAAGVLAGGSLNFTDILSSSGSGVVRPAFWLDLGSDIS